MAQTPDQIAANWASRLAASSQKITDGINGVTVAPGQAAARQAQVWAQNTAAAVQKYQTNVGAVSLQSWQQSAITKGVPRIASGATAAQPAFATFMGKLLPYIAQQKQALPPRGNLQQNLDRMVKFATGMSNFKNQ